LGAAVRKNRERCGKAKWRKHFTAGRSRGILLALIAERSDLTLDEVVLAMEKRRIAGSRSAVWRFFDRRNISFKKNFVRDGAKAGRRGPRAPALDARARHV
jgi:transposase